MSLSPARVTTNNQCSLAIIRFAGHKITYLIIFHSEYFHSVFLSVQLQSVKGRQDHVMKKCHEYFNILAVKYNICEKVTDLSIDYNLNLNTNV